MPTRIEITNITTEPVVHRRTDRLVLPEESGIHQTLLGEIHLDLTGMQTREYPRHLQITGGAFGEGVVFDMYDDVYGPTQGVTQLAPGQFVRVQIGE